MWNKEFPSNIFISADLKWFENETHDLNALDHGLLPSTHSLASHLSYHLPLSTNSPVVFALLRHPNAECLSSMLRLLLFIENKLTLLSKRDMIIPCLVTDTLDKNHSACDFNAVMNGLCYFNHYSCWIKSWFYKRFNILVNQTSCICTSGNVYLYQAEYR